MTRKLLLSIFFFFKHSTVEFKVFQVFYKYIVLEHEKESHKKQIFVICVTTTNQIPICKLQPIKY